MKISCKGAVAAASWWLVVIALLCSGMVTAADDNKADQKTPTEVQDAQSQQQVAILKQINRVNDDGSYTFGYEAADGSFKIETRDVLGNVKGMFGFLDESGELKRVSYSASNKTGFQSTGTLAPGSEGEEKSESATRPPATPPLLYQQIIRPIHGIVANDAQATTRRPLLRPTVVRESLTTTTGRPESSTRRPVLLYAQTLAPVSLSDAVETSTRAAVIQSIPRARRPQDIPSSTERPLISSTTRRPLQLYGQYIRPGGQPVKQIFVTPPPAPVDEMSEQREATTVRTSGVIYGHYVRPTEIPTSQGQVLRRVVLARRPEAVSSTEASLLLHAKQYQERKAKEEEKRGMSGNALRRQLAPQDRGLPPQVVRARQSGTDDSGDVYGGSIGGSPRPIPATPFRGLFTPNQPRPAQSAVLQSQLLQGIAGTRPDDLGQQVPPGAIPSGVGGSIRIPLGVIRGGVLDSRVPPGAFQYPSPQGYPTLQGYPTAQGYPSPQGYPYAPPQGPAPDLQEQLLQLLLGRQQPRQPVYVNDYPYRQSNPVQQQLTPFQIALMMTLGENIPPELLDDPYQRQQPVYNPQQTPYNRQPVGYPATYNPQPVQFPQQPVAYPAPGPSPAASPPPTYPPQTTYAPSTTPAYGQQIPYNQAVQYDPQQAPVYNPQYQQPYPVNYPGQVPYPGHIPYHIRRRLRYRPQPVYAPPLPYGNNQAVNPDYYSQPQPFGARNPQNGYPQEYLPDEYRDALILRMLLAVRAAQQQTRGSQHRPVEHNPNIQERSQPYYATDSSSTSTTTVRPRTLTPVRNVQILDPVTEESQAKRSTEKTPSRS